MDQNTSPLLNQPWPDATEAFLAAFIHELRPKLLCPADIWALLHAIVSIFWKLLYFVFDLFQNSVICEDIIWWLLSAFEYSTNYHASVFIHKYLISNGVNELALEKAQEPLDINTSSREIRGIVFKSKSPSVCNCSRVKRNHQNATQG